ncbi:MAG: leucine--tRNA ligase [Candidatus Woesearchaeota archaeon]
MADFKKIQEKCQNKWEEAKIFKAAEDKAKKFYVLEMFPYPSGSGLHMGHAFNYTIGDIYARFMRMKGHNVLYPMGYDSLGLPAENAAIKEGVHPKEYTEKSIANFIRQQKELGLSYDWDRVVKTHDPSYYKWDQWIFLKMLEKGIAYRKKAPVNYCSKCNTVLANEQVHDGKCWRHSGTQVEIKHLEQWFFKITDYADELYESIGSLKGWADDVKAMQRNWIGKSHGTEIDFTIDGKKWTIFTTRPDTIYGVTFMVIAAQHPKLMDMVKPGQKKEVEDFLKKIKSTSEKDAEELNKEGAFTGSYAINPLTGDSVPVYAGNFVIAEYGSGMVMAVPAHDQRDFEFAKKYNIPITVVIQPDAHALDAKKMLRAYTADGNLVGSAEFDGMNNRDAIDEITKSLEKKGLGRKSLQFKLRDWLVSRQRYWGTPIPIVYCEKCGIVAVPEDELPIELPEDVKFGEGNPLASSEKFVNATCPNCKGKARRETDTMDTFVNSSWYFLRYTDARNNNEIFSKEKAKYWMPIDLYIGGKEHACMHLIYFRFYTKFFRDIGMLGFDEPTYRQFNQGMLHKEGAVMSKSKGNVVLPEEISKTLGIDTARLFLVSIASPDKDLEWSDEGISGSLRFVNKMLYFFEGFKEGVLDIVNASRFNRLLKEYASDIQQLKYNLAVIKLKDMFSAIEKGCSKDDAGKFVRALSPICPHLAEEFWEVLGNQPFVSVAEWPESDESKINLVAEAAHDSAFGLVADISGIIKMAKIEKPEEIKIIVSASWKYGFARKLKREMEKTRDVGELIRSCMDKDHGKEVSKLVPMFVKNPSKLPKVVVTQEQELNALNENKEFLAAEFSSNVTVEKAEDSSEAKAAHAMPGKPAIVVK